MKLNIRIICDNLGCTYGPEGYLYYQGLCSILFYDRNSQSPPWNSVQIETNLERYGVSCWYGIGSPNFLQTCFIPKFS